MAALICLGCSTVYSVGAPACPQCGADDPVPDDQATVEQVRDLIAATPQATVKSAPPQDTASEMRGEPGPELAVPTGQKVAPPAGG